MGRIPDAVEGGGRPDLLAQPEGHRAMSGTDVTVEQYGDHVAVVCMHRPPNNYFDTVLLEEVAVAYEELDRSGWCRAVVLASEGRRFSAGLDFAGNAGSDIAELYQAALRLFAAPLPVVAAVQGRPSAVVAGSRCRRTSGSPAAQSRFSGEIRAARLPPRLRSLRHAAADGRPAGGGRPVADGTARRGCEALALGLCDRLAGDGDVMAQALGYASELAASSRWPCAPSGRHSGRGLVEEARLAMEHECAEQVRLRDSADFAEGVRAAAERRPPRFSGSWRAGARVTPPVVGSH